MKRCPQCSEVYSDQLQFCLRDGSQLSTITADDSAPRSEQMTMITTLLSIPNR